MENLIPKLYSVNKWLVFACSSDMGGPNRGFVNMVCNDSKELFKHDLPDEKYKKKLKKKC